MKKTKKSKLIFRIPFNELLFILFFLGMIINIFDIIDYSNNINIVFAVLFGIGVAFVELLSHKKIKIVNLVLGLKGQLPLKRFYRNFFITGNAWGMFHINSHVNANSGKPKQMSSTKEKAEKAARSMEKKYLKKENKIVHFSVYKCVFCDGWHIGKNRDNK